VVVCDTSHPPHDASLALDAADTRTPLLTARPQPGDPVLSRAARPAPRIRLEVPTDFTQLLADVPADARLWHAATREHFQWALANAYAVTGLRRDPATSRSFYLLELQRPTSAPAT